MTRVLLVEDEPDLADPLAYLLHREGFEVEIAEDGDAALTAFRERGADILLLDLPPGTGDIAISTAQLLPASELLVVTTPQHAAAQVAARAGQLAEQTGQTVAGVVENMGPMTLPDGTVLDVFGTGGGAEVAERLSGVLDTQVPLLGTVPLDPALRAGGDAGDPVVMSAPESPAGRALTQIAQRVAVRPRGLAGRRLPVTPR